MTKDGRFENPLPMAYERRCVWRLQRAGGKQVGRGSQAGGRKRIFRAVAFALDQDGLGAMQNSGKDGDRDAGS